MLLGGFVFLSSLLFGVSRPVLGAAGSWVELGLAFR